MRELFIEQCFKNGMSNPNMLVKHHQPWHQWVTLVSNGVRLDAFMCILLIEQIPLGHLLVD
jgi:hypothetical protein